MPHSTNTIMPLIFFSFIIVHGIAADPIPSALWIPIQSHIYLNNRAAYIFFFTCSFFYSIIPIKLSHKFLLCQLSCNVNCALLTCPFFLISHSFYISMQADYRKKINRQRQTIIGCVNKDLNGKDFTNFPLRTEYF